MSILLLVLVYISFISIGLPDTLLGSAWPVMRPEFGKTLDAAGLISLVVSFATIASCLLNERFVRRFGTARIAAMSCLITAVSLFGYSQSPSYAWLVLFSVPLGFGAGAVDTCLNNYGALHFPTRQVNWMHCFYGLGATMGPAFLALVLADGQNWRNGYLIIAAIQIGISVILFLTLPVWKDRDYRGEPLGGQGETARKPAAQDADGLLPVADSGGCGGQGPPVASKTRQPLWKIPGVVLALLSYALIFCLEYGTAIWTPSYLVGARGFSPESAAYTASAFYACLMIGRFLSGVISAKLSDQALIRLGAALCMLGALCLALPLPSALYYVAVGFLGLGCAPIFPSMIHLTPGRFGRNNSHRVMGVQMAAAYTGCMLGSPIIGFTAERLGLLAIPCLLFLLGALLLFFSEWVDRIVAPDQAIF